MAGLSFGSFGTAFPSGLDLSLGSSDLTPKVYSGRGSYGMPTVAKSPTDFQYAKTTRPAPFSGFPNLSLGKSVPKVSSETFTPVPALSYGGKSPSVSNIANALPFNFGKVIAPVYDDAILRRSRSPIPSVPTVDTIDVDASVGAADAAKDLAGQIFGEMLLPARFGGAPGGNGVSSEAGFMDRLSTQDILLIAAALGVAFMVLSGGNSGRRRRR